MSFRKILHLPTQLSIRAKLLLASTVLLIFPNIGFQYIQELETFLRNDQQLRLLDNAKILSNIIASQKELTNIFLKSNSSLEQQHLFVRSLQSPILLDGYKDDWQPYFDREKFFSSPKSTLTENSDPPSFKFLSGHYQHSIYLFFEITDSHLVYRQANQLDIENCDSVIITTETEENNLTQYIVSTHSPGKIQARKIQYINNKKSSPIVEERIQAVWQETRHGYNVEIRLPDTIPSAKIAFSVVDVDNPARRQQRQVISATEKAMLAKNIYDSGDLTLTSLTIPSIPLNNVLTRFSMQQSRTWLLNRNAQVIAVSGSIYDNEAEIDINDPENSSISITQFFYGLVRLIYLIILPQPSEVFSDETARTSSLQGSELDEALQGHPTTKWRLTENKQINILRAVQPIYKGNEIIGAVAVERNNNSILILQNRAVEILMNTSIILFIILSITLIAFATRLSSRIKLLRDETDSAISNDGRIIGSLTPSPYQDEIGDLQRSYASMLIRLGDYNRYLESMASKLSHELRTPITVVKSSLENLELNNTDEASVAYIKRARDGVDRLNHILTRMSEATRLEHTLKSEEKIPLNLLKLISSCVAGYQIAYKNKELTLETKILGDESNVYILASADLIAQLLDKLVSNAVDFATKGSAIIVELDIRSAAVVLSVKNVGPHLPDEMQNNLFESMVSIRKLRGDEPHLGLGLYIVRLIADFHVGKPFARDTKDPDGVQIGVEFPRLKTDERTQTTT